EGAGSPVELNLIHKDLANTFVAKEFDTKIILVADIEKGGVFASIYGTLNLLEPKLRKNVIGVIINKFRGDPTLFDEGIKIIEKDFKVPVLGVIPYAPFNLGFEDSQSLVNYKQIKKKWKIKVGVVLFPRMSNYNDIEPLIADSEIKVEFISSDRDLKEYDLVILPGTKSTIEDLKWLKKVGLYERILKTNVKLYGICGGYQMFFKNIIDKDCVENLKRQKERGFGFIDDKIIFKNKKILNRGNYFVFSMKIKGFEIHNGVSKKYPLFCQKKNLKGSFIHGIFDNNNFRKMIFTSINKDYQGFDFGKYKKKKISKFVNLVKKNIDLNLLEN
ncbi:MAG: cobyric acid synthase, partial [Campylobacterales bacterium]|nr:cobyric acid synthase [Campylobacterales bacterium]